MVPLRSGWTGGHASTPGPDHVGMGRRGVGDLGGGPDGMCVVGVGGVSVSGVRVGGAGARAV